MAAPTNYRLRSGTPRLRRDRPQSYGLVGAWSWGNGATGNSNLQGTLPNLAAVGAQTYDGALGLQINTTTSLQVVTCPLGLRLQYPFTIILKGYQIAGSITGSPGIFGVNFNVANTSPFCSYLICVNGSNTDYRIAYNNGSFQQASTVGNVITASTPVWLAFTMVSGKQTVYYNAVPSPYTPNNITGTIGYGSDAPIYLGGSLSTGFNPKFAYDHALIYNRETSINELKWLFGQGNDLFARRRDWAGWVAAMDGATAVTAQPAALLPAM